MNLWKKTLLALALTGILAGTAWAQAPDPALIHIRVLAEAEVFHDSFTLGEVAEMDGFDLEAIRAIAAVKLGRSPLPGRTLRLNESMIRSRLKRAINPARLVLVVPRKAQVSRAATHVSGSVIEAMVLERAARDAGVPGTALKQELRGKIADAVLPKGMLEWEVRPMGNKLSTSGGRTYLVVARVDGEEVWRTTVRLNQKIYRDVVIAKVSIRRNEIITADNLKVERRPFTGQTEQTFISEISQVAGKRARRPIGRNEPLHKELLTIPLAIKEGGRVRVVYQTPQLVLEVQGVALSGGHLGQFIPVKNLQSGKVVYGVVDGNETVRVN